MNCPCGKAPAQVIGTQAAWDLALTMDEIKKIDAGTSGCEHEPGKCTSQGREQYDKIYGLRFVLCDACTRNWQIHLARVF